MTNNIESVDMVYLWVNGNDPQWQAKRNAVIGNVEAASPVNCKGRYADNDELKYSLRSLEAYAPWIRRIFIVTDNQTPEWLDTSNPRIRIVDHTEILPEESLPCFNSRVIEYFLCRIPGLSEHFLYANDDMFFNRPATPETFFGADGLPIVRFNRRPFRKLVLLFREKILRKNISAYNRAIQRAAELVEEKYGIYFGDKTHHNIDSYLKSNCEHVCEVFKEEMKASQTNHVRSAGDVQRNVFSYVPLAEKRAHLQYVTRKTSFRLHIEKEYLYEKLDRYNPLLFCMNDSEYARDCDRVRAKEYLDKRFPDKSRFEK